MQRWRGLQQIPSDWGRSVVTIGVFDGVHRGHATLIGRAVTRARELDLPSVVLTFDPHPAEVVRPGSHPAQLTTLRRRAELVAELGVDVFCVLPFTVEQSQMPPESFVHELLVEQLHAAVVVVGDNFKFGHKAAGDVALLGELGQRFGFSTERAELVAQDDVTFSSTYIRSCIDAGEVQAAATALGRPHRIEGIVIRGDGRGEELGYPTANLATPQFAAIPADGVYACWFLHRGQRLRAAVSVGTNPTFSGRERRVEAFVVDHEADLYGEQVAVDFVTRLRGMERFDDPRELVAEMDRDVVRTRQVLAADGNG